MVKLLPYQTLNSEQVLNYAKLVYHRFPWREPDAPYLVEVLYEDEYLIAANKPSGLQVLPEGLYQQRTVLIQLQWHARKLTTKFISLSKNTSSPSSSPRKGYIGCTSSEFNTTRKICKIYRALVSGVMELDEVVIKQPIGTTKYPGVAKGLYVACPSGKPALGSVRVLERDSENNCTLVQVEIQYGRPHQIRINLSFIGFPLIGDPLYVSGGQPRCFHPELMGESFEKDGGYQRPENPVPGDWI